MIFPHARLIAQSVAPDSPVRTKRFRSDHVLFRPYSPRGMTASGLWLQRNPAHPKIWGWLLAVTEDAYNQNPALVPGSMLVVRRHQGEPIAKETPPKVKYLGHHFPVIALPIDAIQLIISPPLVDMENA
jgi:hypothetical protein